MPRLRVPGGWFASACLLGSVVWACSGGDTNPFSNGSRGGQSSSGGNTTGGGGTSGSSSGGVTGGSPTGGASGSSTGGDATGGMTPTGGTTGDGGAAADSGNDSGGTTMAGMSGASGAGGAGTGGTPSIGGAGASGAPVGGAGVGAAGLGGAGLGGAGAGGAGAGGAGKGGSGGGPVAGCKLDTDCSSSQYCKKESCTAEEGRCQARGPECRGTTAAFDPVCGCDGITYFNTCVIEHEGFNLAMKGECTGNNRPTCTRDDGGDSCPPRQHAHCYRPVAMCGDPSPAMGVCWVLPSECPTEPQTQRYCGGTAGQARCIGLCEVIDAENSFRRDAPTCAATTN